MLFGPSKLPRRLAKLLVILLSQNAVFCLRVLPLLLQLKQASAKRGIHVETGYVKFADVHSGAKTLPERFLQLQRVGREKMAVVLVDRYTGALCA